MNTQIPEYIDSEIRDKAACGDYRPVSSETGPINGNEWLALIEDEASIQLDNYYYHRDHPGDLDHAKVCLEYHFELMKLSFELSQEGFRPVKFHWEKRNAV